MYAFIQPQDIARQEANLVENPRGLALHGLGDLMDPSTWGLTELLLFGAVGYLVYSTFFSSPAREKRTAIKRARSRYKSEVSRIRKGRTTYGDDEPKGKKKPKREDGDESPSGKKWSKGRWVSPDTYDEEQLA